VSSVLSDADRQALRDGIANLPRAENHKAGQAVDPERMLVVPGHRAALDPDRPLVVANRGMGKSFWTHALADEGTRSRIAGKIPSLGPTDVVIGFNASERADSSAPTPTALASAFHASKAPEALWRSVLARIATERLERSIPALRESFADAVNWTVANGEVVDRLLTELDDQEHAKGRKLVVVFDALDKLANDWKTVRELLKALLQRALAAQSYRALRLKLFIRRDQSEDRTLFEFTDSSKLQNTRVELSWTSGDLYELLFTRLSQDATSAAAFGKLRGQLPSLLDPSGVHAKVLVDALAGEFMGAGENRGRVFTWLPLHLSDAHGETSPRTFLTAWREAAHHTPVPETLPVDHRGLLEGVRRASEDRLHELHEDYWWIGTALAPLRGQTVPIDRAALESLWKQDGTVQKIRQSTDRGLVPVHLESSTLDGEQALAHSLSAIGVIEVRSTGKINVPDIFRVEAGIKRKGGVKPPRRANGST